MCSSDLAVFKSINPITGDVIATEKVEGFVIPKQGSNIIYYKWHVPSDYDVDSVKLQCDINTTKVKGTNGIPGVNEMDYTDNTDIGVNEVQKYRVMETPDTIFENAPNGFIKPIGNEKVPYEKLSKNIIENTSWEVWEWDKKTDGT